MLDTNDKTPASPAHNEMGLIIWPRWDRLPRWRVRLAAACLGVVGLVLGWLVAGALGLVPSMVAVLGWSGIRLPGSIVVGCLLVASLALGQA